MPDAPRLREMIRDIDREDNECWAQLSARAPFVTQADYTWRGQLKPEAAESRARLEAQSVPIRERREELRRQKAALLKLLEQERLELMNETVKANLTRIVDPPKLR